jgi:Ni/Fe-hydrogenase subunit HybB-like protein
MTGLSEHDGPAWRRPLPQDQDLAQQVHEAQERHLLLDARPPEELASAVLQPMQRVTPRFWLAFLVLGAGVLLLGIVWGYQMWFGLGVTGLRRPAMWAVYIANFVYFIGIGHAGTFISAALRVLRFQWRAPISRAAETLTVFALSTAALFPLIHLGRSWKFYWLLPYPNERQIWPSYHSPLLWDLTAILTYLGCSILFEWMGLLPDLAMARDRIARGWRHQFFRVVALGWRGTELQWKTLETALNVFSYAIIPVMFSVHTIVSWDFAMALQPGWHSSIFGPYFVIGALFSGVGAVIITLILLRKVMHLEYFLRAEHFDGLGKFLLVLSMAWAYFYFNDYIVPWYGREPVIRIISHAFERGWASPLWYLMLFSNILLPIATLWSRRLRTSLPVILGVAIFVQVGMYIERYLIVSSILGYNELPFSWGIYVPQWPEMLITLGAFSFLAFLYLVFSKVFPIIPVWEIQMGQVTQGLRRIGRAIVPTRADPD